jgi:hypothetical protein
MANDPLVTFVVPCYKHAHLLSQCVNSILAQDYEDFEVLIMDNCSPDNTPEVARSFKDPRVKHIRNEENLGHMRNFNKGLTLARGKYVWVLSADDKLRSSHVLGRYVDTMEQNPRAGFVFCRSTELHEGEETGIARWADCGDEDTVWKEPNFLIRLIDANCIVASSVMMRKSSVEKVGLYPIDIPFACDWYLWCMLAMHDEVAYLAEPMVCCRFHEQSLTTQYSQDHTRICISDELTVLWRVGQQAGLEGNVVIRGACNAAFVLRAYHLLMAGLQNLSPGMTADQFEEILQKRMQASQATAKIRTAVYSSLALRVRDLLYKDSLFIRNSGELSVLWSLLHQADLAGVQELRVACEAVFLRRSVSLLTAGLHGEAPSLNPNELQEIFRSQSHNLESTKEIRATVYSNLGDQLYSHGEYANAAQSYWFGLKARPWRPKTWTKYLLMRTGGIGIRIRQLAN